MNCERRGDHCHHPNQHGFSYFYGLPFTLFNDCVPGEGSDILADLQKTLRSLTLFLGIGLATLVRPLCTGLQVELALWLRVSRVCRSKQSRTHLLDLSVGSIAIDMRVYPNVPSILFDM